MKPDKPIEQAKRFRELYKDTTRNYPYVIAFVDRPVLITWIERGGRVVREQVVDPPARGSA